MVDSLDFFFFNLILVIFDIISSGSCDILLFTINSHISHCIGVGVGFVFLMISLIYQPKSSIVHNVGYTNTIRLRKFVLFSLAFSITLSSLHAFISDKILTISSLLNTGKNHSSVSVLITFTYMSKSEASTLAKVSSNIFHNTVSHSAISANVLQYVACKYAFCISSVS